MSDPWLRTLILLIFVTHWNHVYGSNEILNCYVCYNSPICSGTLVKLCKNARRCTTEESAVCNDSCDVIGIFPVPDKPKEYFICQYNESTNRFEKKVLKCSSGTIYNTRTMKCLTREERRNLAQLPPMGYLTGSKICEQQGRMPIEDDVKQYYECDRPGMHAKVIYCPVFQYYDEKLRECVPQITKNIIDKMRVRFEKLQKTAIDIYKNIKSHEQGETHRTQKIAHNVSDVKPRIVFGNVVLDFTEAQGDPYFEPVGPIYNPDESAEYFISDDSDEAPKAGYNTTTPDSLFTTKKPRPNHTAWSSRPYATTKKPRPHHIEEVAEITTTSLKPLYTTASNVEVNITAQNSSNTSRIPDSTFKFPIPNNTTLTPSSKHTTMKPSPHHIKEVPDFINIYPEQPMTTKKPVATKKPFHGHHHGLHYTTKKPHSHHIKDVPDFIIIPPKPSPTTTNDARHTTTSSFQTTTEDPLFEIIKDVPDFINIYPKQPVTTKKPFHGHHHGPHSTTKKPHSHHIKDVPDFIIIPPKPSPTTTNDARHTTTSSFQTTTEDPLFEIIKDVPDFINIYPKQPVTTRKPFHGHHHGPHSTTKKPHSHHIKDVPDFITSSLKPPSTTNTPVVITSTTTFTSDDTTQVPSSNDISSSIQDTAVVHSSKYTTNKPTSQLDNEIPDLSTAYYEPFSTTNTFDLDVTVTTLDPYQTSPQQPMTTKKPVTTKKPFHGHHHGPHSTTKKPHSHHIKDVPDFIATSLKPPLTTDTTAVNTFPTIDNEGFNPPSSTAHKSTVTSSSIYTTSSGSYFTTKNTRPHDIKEVPDFIKIYPKQPVTTRKPFQGHHTTPLSILPPKPHFHPINDVPDFITTSLKPPPTTNTPAVISQNTTTNAAHHTITSSSRTTTEDPLFQNIKDVPDFIKIYPKQPVTTRKPFHGHHTTPLSILPPKPHFHPINDVPDFITTSLKPPPTTNTPVVISQNTTTNAAHHTITSSSRTTTEDPLFQNIKDVPDFIKIYPKQPVTTKKPFHGHHHGPHSTTKKPHSHHIKDVPDFIATSLKPPLTTDTTAVTSQNTTTTDPHHTITSSSRTTTEDPLFQNIKDVPDFIKIYPKQPITTKKPFHGHHTTPLSILPPKPPFHPIKDVPDFITSSLKPPSTTNTPVVITSTTTFTSDDTTQVPTSNDISSSIQDTTVVHSSKYTTNKPTSQLDNEIPDLSTAYYEPSSTTNTFDLDVTVTTLDPYQTTLLPDFNFTSLIPYKATTSVNHTPKTPDPQHTTKNPNLDDNDVPEFIIISPKPSRTTKTPVPHHTSKPSKHENKGVSSKVPSCLIYDSAPPAFPIPHPPFEGCDPNALVN